MVTAFLTFCLFAVVPHEDVLVDDVDLVEVNHFHDEQGKQVYTQIIFYDWNESKSRFDIVAWRILPKRLPSSAKKSTDYAADLPVYNERTGTYVVTWNDMKTGAGMRKVNAGACRETFTQFDPEQEARTKLPLEQRRGFSRPAVRVPVIAETSLARSSAR